MERKAQRIEIDFGKPEGTWIATLHPEGGYSIGGKPSPSESQAHAFDFVVRAINRLANMPFEEIKTFAEGE